VLPPIFTNSFHYLPPSVRLISFYQLCLGIIASGIGFVLRPAWCRSVSRYRMDAMILG